MTKSEQYGLDFYVWTDPETDEKYFRCTRAEVSAFSHLQFLSRVDIVECKSLVDEIEKAEQNLPHDDCPTSDGFADVDIVFEFPNVTINEALTISMTDFKELLIEWQNFIQQKST